jgi:hypothetical protein
MGVENVGLKPFDNFSNNEERFQIINQRYIATELFDNETMDPLVEGQVCHIPFAGAQAAANEQSLILIPGKLTAQGNRLDSRPADV